MANTVWSEGIWSLNKPQEHNGIKEDDKWTQYTDERIG